MKRIMRNYVFAVLSCLTFLSAFGQEKFYVCEKYDSEGYNILSSDSVFKEFVFSDDLTEVKIGNDTYNVADIDSIVFTAPQFPCVNIVWDGSSATVTVDPSITGISYAIKGGHVVITSTNVKDEILYVLSGSSSDGSLTLNGSYKLTMHLNGVSLTSKKGAALDIECGKRVEMKLMKGTENTFVDSSNGSQKAALYCKGHLEVKGKGILNVTGNTKHAIGVKEYLQFKPSTGTINVLGAVGDGIHCGKASKAADEWENCRFIMNGGTVNVAGCGGDCIDADDYGSMYINDGTIDMKVSQERGNGLKCDSILRMTGGVIKMEVTGTTSDGIQHNYHSYFSGGTIEGIVSGNGSMGIYSKKTTKTTDTVLKGGDVYFQGTDVTLEVSGETTPTADECIGIAVDGNYTQTAGSIHVKVSSPDAKAYDVLGSVTVTGGTMTEE